MSVRPGAEPYSHDGTGDHARTGIVLAHGFTGSPASMRPWGQFLAEAGYTVRVPRLPGHGTTWQEMNRTRWQDWYAAVDSAFRELHEQCDQVFVAGLSMGGALATRLAQEHGPRVRGLMLVNPAYKVDDIRLRALPVLQTVLPSLPGIGNDIKKAGEDEVCYDRIPLKALFSQTRLWATVVRDLPEVTQPVVLWHSVEDHIVPTSSSELFLSRVSSTDVTENVLHDSYHVATLDHDAPRIFEESVQFIERLS
ncbi:alpha/beta fold hydrolase [Pedococcus aerophilus]|uniref:Alpha/beta fold hydrolase n=1 Tax=Pedococcus aerophilus TaxID=436356 RepID=A0ABN3UGL3_9MICO